MRKAIPCCRRLAAEIAAAPRLKKIVYLSTIGVYGDRGGGEVDESAELEPVSSRSAMRVKAERDWVKLAADHGKTLYILRLSGIYGPGRNVLVNLRTGKARRLIKPGQVFNRIHVEDIGRAIAACFAGEAPGGVYNVTDNEPAPPQDVIVYAAGLLGDGAAARTGFRHRRPHADGAQFLRREQACRQSPHETSARRRTALSDLSRGHIGAVEGRFQRAFHLIEQPIDGV